MKIKVNIDRPKVGDKRIVNRFLLFPKVVGDNLVWLETIKVKQVAEKWVDMSSGSYGVRWVDIEVVE